MKKQIIKQLTLDGVLVAEYKSIYDVESKSRMSHAGISKCINGKQKSAYGFKWERIIKQDKKLINKIY